VTTRTATLLLRAHVLAAALLLLVILAGLTDWQGYRADPATPTPVPTLEKPYPRPTPSARGERPAVLVKPIQGKATATASPTPKANHVAETDKMAAKPEPRRLALGTWIVTAFTNHDAGMDGRGVTRSGEIAGPGTAAADLRFLPLRSVIEVEGLGRYTVLDTGSEVIGRHVDLWHASRVEALRFGVQTRAIWRVYP
jgi:3D (Asp-Asp-Asp) domain-containing protein